MKKDQHIKFAVAGCGYVGEKHIKNILHHPCCELTALVDSDKKMLERFSYLNIPLLHSMDDLSTLEHNADVIVIATPNGTHASLALQALEQGMHVLIEKPMALKKKDAREIIHQAENAGKQVMVVLQNRFSAVSKWLKHITEDNVLGELYQVQVNCFWNRDDRYYTPESWHGTHDMDGGTLFTQFSHFIDTLYWLFGDMENIESRFYNHKHQHLELLEDSGIITFDFRKGGAGCLHFSTASWDKNTENSITIIAENGGVKVSGQYMDTVEYCHIKNYIVPDLQQQRDNQYCMLDEMINAIQHKKPTNAADGMHVVGLIEQMYARVKTSVS